MSSMLEPTEFAFIMTCLLFGIQWLKGIILSGENKSTSINLKQTLKKKFILIKGKKSPSDT